MIPIEYHIKKVEEVSSLKVDLFDKMDKILGNEEKKIGLDTLEN
jgi:hypothetical protein